MSHPQLKLPKKSTDSDIALVPDTSLPSSMQSHVAGILSIPVASPSPVVTVASPSLAAHPDSAEPNLEQVRLESIANRILGRFRPVDKDWFYVYAKSLMHLTDGSLNRSRDTLARIYRYRDLYEIMQALTQPGQDGPFDDDISDNDWETDIVQAALTERKVRTIGIIRSRNPNVLYDPETLCTSDAVYNLGLFNIPQTHQIAVRELRIPKGTSAERRMRRQAFDIKSSENPDI